jgi:hypothetical protein
MKSRFVAVGMMAVLLAIVVQAQTPPSAPGPEHAKLNIWVGDWTHEAVVLPTPLGPGGKYVGKTQVRPILGGFFVEFRLEETGPTGKSQYHEIDGYDAKSKRYTWFGFSSDGETSSVTYTIDGNKVNYSGTLLRGDKQYQIRGNVTFNADRTRWDEKREVSTDGKTWLPNFQSTFTKVKP